MRDNELTMLAVGDVMTGCGYFHSLVGDSIPRALNDPERSVLADEVAAVLREGDLTFGNLECVVTETFDINADGIPQRLMGPEETTSLLEQAGFDLMNIANNHILDHGPAYVDETTTLLETHGIDHIGNPLEEGDPVTYSIQGREMTFRGYYLPDLDDEVATERIRSQITDTDDPDQLTVVSLHWGIKGTEHMSRPSPKQVSFARELIDHGADVILGHHSHSFQPVERYNGGIIAYSLGNFVFDMWREQNRKSGILKIVVDDGIEASIIPTEQTNYCVQFTDEHFIRDVQDTPVESESVEAYRAVSDRVRRRHQLEVIKQFVTNAHRFPPRYHVSTYKRWMKKARQEFTESTGTTRQ